MEDSYPIFFEFELYFPLMLLAAIVVLLALILGPRLEKNKYLTAPIFFLFLGGIVFSTPLPWELPELMGEPWLLKRITELGVIIALASAGLKIKNPFDWETWENSIWLLIVAMPLTILLTALLGWWALGLAPASAILLGAVIAPTDPVLADDVQSREPETPDSSKTRLALTTEAGLNDGLAFPFTNLAIAVALVGLDPSGWLVDWLVIDVLYKITVGTFTGACTGWLLAYLLFQTDKKRSSRIIGGVFAVSLVFIPYSVAELVSGYGFIAVFIASCIFRQQETAHKYKEEIHDFSVSMEQLLETLIMLMVGGFIAFGALQPLSIPIIITALAILFLVRPLSSYLALSGNDLPKSEKWVISFFGIRGIGSLYYLSYGIYYADFPQAEELWAITLLIITLSVIVHGTSAKPVMDALDGGRLNNS